MHKDKTAENLSLVGTTVKLGPGKQCKFQCDPVLCPCFKFHTGNSIIGQTRWYNSRGNHDRAQIDIPHIMRRKNKINVSWEVCDAGNFNMGKRRRRRVTSALSHVTHVYNTSHFATSWNSREGKETVPSHSLYIE